MKKIKNNLQDSYISIIADETSDVGHNEQLSIVVRYFLTLILSLIDQLKVLLH